MLLLCQLFCAHIFSSWSRMYILHTLLGGKALGRQIIQMKTKYVTQDELQWRKDWEMCTGGRENINSLTCCGAAARGLWLVITVNSDVLVLSPPVLSCQASKDALGPWWGYP